MLRIHLLKKLYVILIFNSLLKYFRKILILLLLPVNSVMSRFTSEVNMGCLMIDIQLDPALNGSRGGIIYCRLFKCT